MKLRLCIAYSLLFAWSVQLIAQDWPMWRADAGRTGGVTTELPERLELKWVRDLYELTPAFHSPRLQFDAGHEPIVASGKLLIASSRTDSVAAYEAKTGEHRWTFNANGPIRFAPAVWRDSVCFGSDDGHMYCVDLSSGSLRWKLRAVPSDRLVLGNRRLISVWPVRGGPVIADGHVYFAAGVWPFEGVFIYSVDVYSGQVVWRNERLGYLFGTQPHNTQAIGGLAPQGYLVVDGDDLVVPCSTAYPARLNRQTGELVEFELPAPGRFPGGWFAAIDPAKAKAIRRGQLTFDDVINRQEHEDKMHKGLGDSGTSRRIVAADRTLNFNDPIEGVDGTVHSMIVAHDQLFVTTRQGQVYCFGSESKFRTDVKRWVLPHEELADSVKSRPQAESLLDNAASHHGFAFVIGIEDGDLVKSLLLDSNYHVVAVDGRAERVERLRQQLVRAGLYGARAAVLLRDPERLRLPPYVATVLTTETPDELGETLDSFCQSLRPYGGLAGGFGDTADLADRLKGLTPGTFQQEIVDGEVLVRRRGALPGSTDYSGNWSASPDKLVRFPLGVLWFDDTLAHFKRSPQPRIVDGVMISRPKDWHAPRTGGDNSVDYPLLPPVLSDIYTGRVLDDLEKTAVRKALPTTDASKPEPSQYRPPGQKNAWKPEQPVAGTRTNPLTGKTEPRTFPKTYGCDGGVDYGSFYTVRSGTPAYYDKTLESGTVFLSGPRSGCTNSIIPAGGVLNVPYFYEGCTCSYPLPSAMSLVTMPEGHEQWSSWGNAEIESDSLVRLGLNFGAPGDRMTKAGTLWLDFPSVGGPSPNVSVSQSPSAPTFQYRHSLWMDDRGDGHVWVAASVVKGLKQLSLHDLKRGHYTVRLSFAELDDVQIGGRVQDVSLQGNVVLEGLDVRAEAGAAMRGIVREVRNVSVDGTLTLQLNSVKGETLISGIELIRE